METGSPPPLDAFGMAAISSPGRRSLGGSSFDPAITPSSLQEQWKNRGKNRVSSLAGHRQEPRQACASLGRADFFGAAAAVRSGSVLWLARSGWSSVAEEAMQCAQFRSLQSHLPVYSCRALARTPMARGARTTACQAAGAIAVSTRLNNAKRTCGELVDFASKITQARPTVMRDDKCSGAISASVKAPMIFSVLQPRYRSHPRCPDQRLRVTVM